MNEVKDLLIAGKQAIVEAGWGQRAYHGEGGLLCMLGGLNRMATGDPEDSGDDILAFGAERLLSRVCNPARDLVSSVGHVISFNDTPGRTVAEVLAKYDEAIALADGLTVPAA